MTVAWRTADLFEYLLRLGDDALVTGHRLSEWTARGPSLEEDLALANLALDCLGHAQLLLDCAASLEPSPAVGRRTADQLVFFRDAAEYRNLLLCELPVAGDFALTVAQQLCLSEYRLLLFQALTKSAHPELAAIAEKLVPELRYHVRHQRSWTIRLGNGTGESHQRLAAAWRSITGYLPELFLDDPLEHRLSAAGVCTSRAQLFAPWSRCVSETLATAGLPALELPPAGCGAPYFGGSGWTGHHTEHLGQMLAVMQSLARAHPGAAW